MKRILINAAQQEELRVAIVDGQKLLDLDIEIPSLRQKKSNIYKGSITRIEPSLNAVFVNYGGARHGFLPFKDITESYYHQNDRIPDTLNANLLKEGQQVLVQIQREERGTKGAALTTYISLAGRYLVLMPNNACANGVSRRIRGQKREEAHLVLEQITLEKEEGLIVRTAGIGRNEKNLQWDLNYLRKLWVAIVKAAKGRPAPFLVYQENDIVIRSLRDHFKDDTNEVVVDTREVYARAEKFVKIIMPTHTDRVHLYEGTVPIFSHYQIEGKIETAYKHEISLASGGSLVFDHTEALLSIDINSGRATKGKDIEETALAINLEACEEIALQLRLRDVGGLIVVDFIDMLSTSNQRKVENALTNAMMQDRAKVQLGRISRFGLLEMSRQRLHPSLGDVSYITCPRCNGSGNIRTLKSSAIAVLRMMEDEASKEKTGQVVAHLPLEVTSYLLNEKRKSINDISKRYGVQLTVVPDIRMEIPHFQISRYRVDDKEMKKKLSYEFDNPRDDFYANNVIRQIEKKVTRPQELPAVSPIIPDRPAPVSSFLRKFFDSLFTRKPATEKSSQQMGPQKLPSNNNRYRRRRGNGRRQNNKQLTRRKNNEYSNRQRQSESKPAEISRSRQSSRKPYRQASKEKAARRSSSADQATTENTSINKLSTSEKPTGDHSSLSQQGVYDPATSSAPASKQTQSDDMPKFSKPTGLTQVETKQQQ